MNHEWKVSILILGVAALAGVLVYFILSPSEKSEKKHEEPVEISDNWADDIIKDMHEKRARYRECYAALCKCVGTASFAVPALERLTKNHPELKSEIMDLWVQYYISDAGCCEDKE